MPALPTFIVIGAMKCGTTALHALLRSHPQIAMAKAKELNFFFGQDTAGDWHAGNWHRGPAWYAGQFDGDRPVRGESSPGYTSPSHPEVAVRMAELVPDARLVYLVRDPVDRAVSQYRHHVREGTERRPISLALPDPDSQYLPRSRFAERLQPFLDHYPPERIAVVRQESLARDPGPTLDLLFTFIGADPAVWPDAPRQGTAPPAPPPHSTPDVGTPGAVLRTALAARFADDQRRLRDLDGVVRIG